MSIKTTYNTRVSRDDSADNWNEIVFQGEMTRSNCFLNNKIQNIREADTNTLTLDSCYFGSTNSRLAETVIDIENVSCFNVTHCFLYNCITDSCFSPDFVNIYNSHLAECYHFRISAGDNLSVVDSSLCGVSISFSHLARVWGCNSTFSCCYFLDCGKMNIQESTTDTREFLNCVFTSITVESRAFNNVSFEKCIFASIFARVNQGYPDYALPFKNCTFKNCHFGNLDPCGKFIKLFHNCTFENCTFEEKKGNYPFNFSKA